MTENLDSQYVSQLVAGVYTGAVLPLDVAPQPQAVEVLSSILTQIGEEGKAGTPYYFAPNRVQVDTETRNVFASTSQPVQKEVAQVVEVANSALKNLPLHPDAWKYSLFYWTYAYGSRIAKQGELSGVSLFDSNRVAAAKLVCDRQLTNAPTAAPYLLLKGDIAGIQQFIYYDADKNLEESGRSKKLSKRLRGRSFYVALLTDFLAEEVVRVTKLEQANIIYSGGGNFLILLPNTELVRKALDELEAAANLSLLEKVGRGLGVYFGVTECAAQVFDDFAASVMKVNRAIDRKKLRQHQHYLEQVMKAAVSTPRFELKQTEASPNEDKPKAFKFSFQDDEWLGNEVPYSHFLVELRFKNPIQPNLLEKYAVVKSLQDFNTYYYMVGETRQHKQFDAQAEREKEVSKIRGLLERCQNDLSAATIHLLNDTDFLQWSDDLKGFPFPVRYGFKFIGNEAPRYDDQDLKGFVYPEATSNEAGILTFTDLAALPRASEKEALGYQQLAVMRLDVDDLGAIFAYGLGNAQNKVALRQISSLSREMHLFFSGYFNHLAAAHRVYITYSGGDDAFVVGSWINIVYFAEALKKEFDRFVCQNKNMHFSAGIYFCNPHFPVAKFANEAEALEKESKKYFKGDKKQTLEAMKQTLRNLDILSQEDKLADKNAIHVFNKTISWEKFEDMLTFALDLDQFVERGSSEKKGRSLSHAVVQRLLAIIKSSRLALENKDDMIFYTNVARLRYLLARNSFGDKELRASQADKLHQLINRLLHDFAKKETFDDYLIPTQYILYSHRKQK